MEKPDWLKPTRDDGKDVEGGGGGSSTKDWDSTTGQTTAASSTTTTTTTTPSTATPFKVDIDVDNHANEEGYYGKESKTTVGSGNDDDKNDAEATGASPVTATCCRKVGSVGSMVLSGVLLVLFVWSTLVQDNDDDSLEWYTFYGLHCAIPALYLTYGLWVSCLGYRCVPPAWVLVSFLCTGMAAWSTAYVVILSFKVADTPAGGLEVDTGDQDIQTLREEYSYELAGVSLGLFSTLYHGCLMRMLYVWDCRRTKRNTTSSTKE